jgi:hypothetical protein
MEKNRKEKAKFFDSSNMKDNPYLDGNIEPKKMKDALSLSLSLCLSLNHLCACGICLPFFYQYIPTKLVNKTWKMTKGFKQTRNHSFMLFLAVLISIKL